jgi:hypothetical protein
MASKKDLVIQPQKNQPLTKEQLIFNQLTKKINAQSAKFQNDQEKFETLLTDYHSNIEPLEGLLAKEKMKMALTLHEKAGSLKFNKKQRERVGCAIVRLMEEAFEQYEPTEEEKYIFDTWAPHSFDEIEAAELELEKFQFRNMAEVFEVQDVDMDAFDPNDPAHMAEFAAKIKEAHEKSEAEREKRKREKKKTKRQMEQEREEKAMKEVEQKSLRVVYISLAKVLHPDSHDTGVDASQKEELMKKVTAAYEAKDLVTLLTIEADWISRQDSNINNLAEDKLKVYINLLRKRLNDMQAEYYVMRGHIRFFPISHLFDCDLKMAKTELYYRKLAVDNEIAETRQEGADLKSTTQKEQILAFADAVNSTALYDDDDDFDFL